MICTDEVPFSACLPHFRGGYAVGSLSEAVGLTGIGQWWVLLFKDFRLCSRGKNKSQAPRGGRTRNLEIKSLTLYRLS